MTLFEEGVHVVLVGVPQTKALLLGHHTLRHARNLVWSLIDHGQRAVTLPPDVRCSVERGRSCKVPCHYERLHSFSLAFAKVARLMLVMFVLVSLAAHSNQTLVGVFQ